MSSSYISLELSGDGRCGGCRRWTIDGIKVRKSRWNAAPIKYKCDCGLHTQEFYRNVPVADRQSLDGNVDAMAVDSDANEDLYTSEASTTSKRPAQCELYSISLKRRQVDYAEKGSEEFKGRAHRNRAGECSLSTGHHQYLNFGTGNNGTPRRKPVKDYRTVKQVEW
jgi:hypothetical protein